VSTWAARISRATGTTWRTAQGNGRVIFCLGTMILCVTTLAVLLAIGEVEKNPGPGEKILQVCVAGATQMSNRELSVTRVEAGSITVVVMLKFKWQRAGNGSVISVDRRYSGC